MAEPTLQDMTADLKRLAGSVALVRLGSSSADGGPAANPAMAQLVESALGAAVDRNLARFQDQTHSLLADLAAQSSRLMASQAGRNQDIATQLDQKVLDLRNEMVDAIVQAETRLKRKIDIMAEAQSELLGRLRDRAGSRQAWWSTPPIVIGAWLVSLVLVFLAGAWRGDLVVAMLGGL